MTTVGPHPLYCQVFVDTALNEEELVSMVARIVDGSIDRWWVKADILEIEVRRNDWILPSPVKTKSFLDFPYYLDIEPLMTAGTARASYIAAIGMLLRGLWGRGYDAVAACGFEDELPKRA